MLVIIYLSTQIWKNGSHAHSTGNIPIYFWKWNGGKPLGIKSIVKWEHQMNIILDVCNDVCFNFRKSDYVELKGYIYNYMSNGTDNLMKGHHNMLTMYGLQNG